MSHVEMKFFLRCVIAHEIAFTEWNLVVELMRPRFTKGWEILIRETAKDHLLVLHLAVNQNDHIAAVVSSLYELPELGRDLVLMSLVLEY